MSCREHSSTYYDAIFGLELVTVMKLTSKRKLVLNSVLAAADETLSSALNRVSQEVNANLGKASLTPESLQNKQHPFVKVEWVRSRQGNLEMVIKDELSDFWRDGDYIEESNSVAQTIYFDKYFLGIKLPTSKARLRPKDQQLEYVDLPMFRAGRTLKLIGSTFDYWLRGEEVSGLISDSKESLFSISLEDLLDGATKRNLGSR